MRLFSEATLLKMETACTRYPKRWQGTAPSPWQIWWNPIVLLRPNEEYTLNNYLRVACTSATFTVLQIYLALCIGVAIGIWLFPDFWTLIRNPKYHALVIGGLSKDGVYQTPFVLLFCVLLTFALRWPQYFFWNRRAIRLQQEGPDLVPVVAAAVPDDVTVWPPAPRPLR